MQKLDFSLKFERVEEKNDGIPAVIVAAGSSTRMKGTDKRFAHLLGVPVLARTMVAFQNCHSVSEIVVVTSEDKIPDVKKLAATYAIDKLSFTVAGGNSREESVKNGLLALKTKNEKALIHDGARPLVTADIIERVAEALKKYDSVTCAVPLKDTVKKIDHNGIVTDTPKRAELVSVQTPQGVNIAAFLAAAENFDLSLFTDDTSVMEAAGKITKTVDGSYRNIKITTPEDIDIAAGMIEKEF